MSYRVGQEDGGAGEDKPIRREDGKLLGALGWDNSGREEGEGTLGLHALCPRFSPGPGTGNNMDGLRVRQEEG